MAVEVSAVGIISGLIRLDWVPIYIVLNQFGNGQPDPMHNFSVPFWFKYNTKHIGFYKYYLFSIEESSL